MAGVRENVGRAHTNGWMGSLECAKRNFPVRGRRGGRCGEFGRPASCHCTGTAVRRSAGKMSMLSVVVYVAYRRVVCAASVQRVLGVNIG